MFARVHQTKRNIVSTHKHGQRIFVGDVDRKRGVPPGRIRKAAFFGITVGIAMGLSPTVRGVLDPLIELYRPVPPLAWAFLTKS